MARAQRSCKGGVGVCVLCVPCFCCPLACFSEGGFVEPFTSLKWRTRRKCSPVLEVEVEHPAYLQVTASTQ